MGNVVEGQWGHHADESSLNVLPWEFLINNFLELQPWHLLFLSHCFPKRFDVGHIDSIYFLLILTAFVVAFPVSFLLPEIIILYYSTLLNGLATFSLSLFSISTCPVKNYHIMDNFKHDILLLRKKKAHFNRIQWKLVKNQDLILLDYFGFCTCHLLLRYDFGGSINIWLLFTFSFPANLVQCLHLQRLNKYLRSKQVHDWKSRINFEIWIILSLVTKQQLYN